MCTCENTVLVNSFFFKSFLRFPKKRHISQRWNLFFRLCLRLQIQFWISKFNPYFPVIQQCTFPCQQIMLDCMDTVKFISILNLKILYFLLFHRQINQEILYTLKLNRLYWKESWNVFKQKGAFKSNPNHKKLEFQSSGPSKTVISRNSGEIRKHL